MNPSFTHRLSLLLAMLHLGYQEPAQAASGPKLEVYLDGQTQPEPPSKGEVIAWGSNHFGQTNVPVAAQSGAVAIAAGEWHTVALKHDGSVLAWGDNRFRQTSVPVQAKSEVVAIAAGSDHTVALKREGSVLAWGYNLSGQTNVPVAAQGGVMAIAAGGSHTVALKEDGGVIAWGSNMDGQTEVPVAAQSGVAAIAAGGNHTVALKQDGRVLAWGRNSELQTKVPIEAQSGVVAIAAGRSHTVALKQDGSVLAWGLGVTGKLFVPIEAQSGVVAIAAEGRAIKQDGSVIAWGFNPAGQAQTPVALQNGVVAIAKSTALVCPSTQYFDSVAVGHFQECTITLRNAGDVDLTNLTPTLTAPGGMDFSIIGAQQLETLSYDSAIEMRIRFTPRRVGQQTAYLSIQSDDPHLVPTLIRLVGTCDGSTMVVTDPLGPALPAGDAGRVLFWRAGDKYNKQISRMIVESGVVAIAAGDQQTVALKQDGRSVEWEFWRSQVDVLPRVPLAAQSGVSAIAAGHEHSLALKQDGSVVAWGSNFNGQTIVPKAAQAGIVAIAAGDNHSVALKQDGRVISWGWNGYAATTIPVAARTGVIAIDAGNSHTVALKRDGQVLVWKYNRKDRPRVPLVAKTGVVAIAAGNERTVALKQDGSVIDWTNDNSGQTQTLVAAHSGVVAVDAHENRTVALKDDGSILAWGYRLTVPPEAKSGVVAVAVGMSFTVVLVEATGEFGHRQLGTVRDHPIQVSSTGTQPLTIHNITLEGPGADQFQILGTLPNPMAALSTSPLKLRYAPNRLGLAQATLRISSDDPVTPEYTLLLQGTGISTLTATRPNVADSAFTYAPLRTDPQTGLMLQTITYTNTTKAQLAGLRLILSKVASRVYVHSSSPGPTPLTYEVIYSNPIAPSETISFDLVYFDPLRRRAHSIQPIIKAEALLEPEPDSPPVDGRLVPLRLAQATPQGPRLDWASAPRAVYVVEYSDDGGQLWHSAVHRLRSGGSQMFWIDRGQPETKTKPTGIPNQPGGRRYRIKKL